MNRYMYKGMSRYRGQSVALSIGCDYEYLGYEVEGLYLSTRGSKTSEWCIRLGRRKCTCISICMINGFVDL